MRILVRLTRRVRPYSMLQQVHTRRNVPREHQSRSRKERRDGEVVRTGELCETGVQYIQWGFETRLEIRGARIEHGLGPLYTVINQL